MSYIQTFLRLKMSYILDVNHPKLFSRIKTKPLFFSAGVIFLSVQQFGRMQKQLQINGFKVCKVPLFVFLITKLLVTNFSFSSLSIVVYKNTEPTRLLVDFFTSQTDIALFFSRGGWQHMNSNAESEKADPFKNVLESTKPNRAEVR